MWSLHNASLYSPDQTRLLTHVPRNIRLLADTSVAGVFLEVSLADGHRTARQRLELGRFPETVSRFAACYRNEPFWMRPAICTRAADIPVETQVLFCRLADTARVALVVPLIDGAVRCALEGTPDDVLALVAETGSAACPLPEMIAGLFIGVQAAGEPLREFMRRCAVAVGEQLKTPLRGEKKLPAFVDWFGWCTWDAFYQEVSAEKLRAGLESFRAAGIVPKFVILDDGWQTEEDCGEAHGRRLTSFAANQKFGNDLGPAIRMAKGEFGVEHFLVWHALQGYWGGVATEPFERYGARECARGFSAGVLHHCPEGNSKAWGSVAGIVPGENAGAFFEDYHASLAAQGVDGVKVDNQGALEAFAGALGVGRVELYRAYRGALEESARKHFGGEVLHCMGCVNDLLYAPGELGLVRTSTDFWPGKPETHGLHVWTHALVALWFGEFVHPDWDMFQSALPGPDKKWSAFHAAARAISGGPVYVSDGPGEHDAELLRKLVCADGSVLRCAEPGVIGEESLFVDPTREGVLLKVRNVARREGFASAGVLGIFNCRYGAGEDSGIEGSFSAGDFAEFEEFGEFAVYLHIHQRHILVSFRERISVVLKEGEFEIATIVAIVGGIAVLGLVDKFNTACGVILRKQTERRLELEARDGGKLAVYCRRRPVGVTFEGEQVGFEWESNIVRVRLGRRGVVVVEWNDLG